MMYEYICCSCGKAYVLSRLDYKHNCPSCNGHVICHYLDDDIEINREWYAEVKENKNLDKTYSYVCHRCNDKQELLAQELHGVACGSCYELIKRTITYSVDKLKHYRQANKLTQQQIANKLHISQNYYSEIERGHKPIPNHVKTWIMKNIAS
jgi:DNA-binding XRE family transcriptional regulator/DNA-directed RNA polymerase subunit RPC12/RpoP